MPQAQSIFDARAFRARADFGPALTQKRGGKIDNETIFLFEYAELNAVHNVYRYFFKG